MAALLPCPFCGSRAEWINKFLGDGHWYIRCSNGLCSVTIKADRQDKTIGLWNTRSKPKPTPSKNFDAIYEMLLPRLHKTGIIRPRYAWEICKKSFFYSPVNVSFNLIMHTMIEQGKVVKHERGQYEIIKPEK